jgi:acyl-CoA synthetase (AMP-forming)/AMP-acid ligase II
LKKLENITFGTLLRRTASRFPARPAIWYSGSEISYAQLVGSVETCGAALCSQGVKRGDHVAIWADNTVESITAFYAVMTMGAVAVMPLLDMALAVYRGATFTDISVEAYRPLGGGT